MIYHNINPTLLKIGFLEIRWYGLMYIFSFILGYLLLKKFFQISTTHILNRLLVEVHFFSI